MFENIKNLVVQGGGVIDGNGKIWWENSCKIDESKVSFQTNILIQVSILVNFL